MTEKIDLTDLDDAPSFFELAAEAPEPIVVTQNGVDAFVVLRVDDYTRLWDSAAPERAIEDTPEPSGNDDSLNAPVPQDSSLEASGDRQAAYESASLPNTPIDADDYQRSTWQGAIVDRMRKVMEAEAPIEKQRLFNMVRGSFGIKRSGRDIQSHNEWLFNRNVEHGKTTFNEATFLWRPDQDPAAYNVYRPTDETSNRQITEFPYEELAAAMQDALAGGTELSRDELIEATMRLLGYKRKTNRVRDVIGAAIEQANHDGILELMPNGTFRLA